MRTILVLFLISAAMVGCAPAATAPSPSPSLVPLVIYRTRTPSPLAAQGDSGTVTPLPSATPTPRTYTVKLNDTYGTIATRYGVTVNDLVAANPDLDPNSLIVGMVLIIPPESEGGNSGVPIPTAVSMQLVPAHCQSTAEGGAWCFTEVTNPQPFAVESALVEFRISMDGVILQTRLGAAPLNLIESGGRLPVGVYFPPSVPEDILVGASLVAALPLEDPGTRYLKVALEDVAIEISPNRLGATARGAVLNLETERGANQVWVLAAARDRQGRVTGIRRWQWQGELTPGESIPYSFVVYSQLEEISSVDLYVEATP